MIFTTRADDEGIDPAIVQSYVSQVRLLIKFQIAIVVILVYDAVLNLDKEVKYFSSCPGKFVSLVYFANRYIGIFGALSLLPCNFSYWARNFANWITIVLIDYILMIRVLALYSQSRKIAITLKMLLGVAVLSRLGVMIHGTLYQGMTVINLTNDTTVCSNKRIVTRLEGAIDWAIPLIYSMILMGLALYKGREFWKLASGFHGFNLVRILILDQFFYFTLAVSCFVINIVLLQVSIPNMYASAFLGSIGSPTLLSVLGSHLLVHLKEAGEAGTNKGTSYRLKTITQLEFA